GFVYLVSRAGVTGARASLPADLPELVTRVKAGVRGRQRRPGIEGSVDSLPLAIGFGISTPEQVREAARLAQGVVVGSAIVRAVGDAVEKGVDPVAPVAELVRSLAVSTAR